MERVILHADCNNFYASVECLYNPSLRGKPVAVAGDPEARHGIVLAKNYLAKACGVQTGNPLWMAKQLCPEIIFVPPHYDKYLRFSKIAREIYSEYTDQVEPFGLDEAWLDVTGSGIMETGVQIANELRKRIKQELGITVSVGISFNKVFAKLGSDMKKPDATTVITRENFRKKVWPLPVSDLLYIGPATTRKLNGFAIHTIGQLADSPDDWLKHKLGKIGFMLRSFARGQDLSPVAVSGTPPKIKSIGNSTTTPRSVTWEDGHVFEIDRVLSSCRRASLKAGGIGTRYTVRIGKHTTYLYFEDPQWSGGERSRVGLHTGGYLRYNKGSREAILCAADTRCLPMMKQRTSVVSFGKCRRSYRKTT